MKYKRKKVAKRILQFLRNSYNFRDPFQILVDGTFCQAALNRKINIQIQLKNYLSADVQIFSTYCVAQEVKELGKEVGGAHYIVKQFKQRHCAHFKNCVRAKDCIMSLIGHNNDHHFFIASQDNELLNAVRLVPGTPIFTISQNSLVLQSPSLQTKQVAISHENEKLRISDTEKKVILDLKSEIIPPKAKFTINKRKIPKGPNPLSMKKSRKQSHLKDTTVGLKSKKQIISKQYKRNISTQSKKEI